jgi:hypothetical protein
MDIPCIRIVPVSLSFIAFILQDPQLERYWIDAAQLSLTGQGLTFAPEDTSML